MAAAAWMARGQPANPLVSDALPFSLASNSVLVLPIGAALGGRSEVFGIPRGQEALILSSRAAVDSSF